MYKIAFSGPSGLGKTTLCKYLTEELGIPWLSTSAGDLMTDEQKKFLEENFGYEGSGHKDVINKSSHHPEFGQVFQSFLLDKRADQIFQNDNLIIDRCPIDNVAYMLSQNSHNMSEEKVKEFIYKAQQAYSFLTHVIQIRFSHDIPFIEDNGSRIANRYFQQYISDVFAGVYARYFANNVGPKVVTIDFWDLVSRKELVKEFVTGQLHLGI